MSFVDENAINGVREGFIARVARISFHRNLPESIIPFADKIIEWIELMKFE
jgi:hypothetical protein